MAMKEKYRMAQAKEKQHQRKLGENIKIMAWRHGEMIMAIRRNESESESEMK
jgi:S-adenosylmethionine synthetase